MIQDSKQPFSKGNIRFLELSNKYLEAVQQE